MRLATIRTPTGTIAVRVTEDGVGIELRGVPDVGALLSHPDYARLSNAGIEAHDLHSADWAPVVPHPGKIICVGLNYESTSRRWEATYPNFPLFSQSIPKQLPAPMIRSRCPTTLRTLSIGKANSRSLSANSTPGGLLHGSTSNRRILSTQRPDHARLPESH